MRQGLGTRWVLAWLAAAGLAQATPSVQVLETWPAGEAVTLSTQENFSLRLAYDSSTPLQIWARPYFRGQPVKAGSNPSPHHPAGRGEALAWFFFFEPGLEVDEVRITASQGGPESTPVATWQGRIVSRAGPPAGTPPPWVAALQERGQALALAAQREFASQPLDAGDALLVSGFFLLFPLLGLLGVAAPAWALWRWRGGWRLAAALPAGLMALVVLRIVLDTARDPTSHNLWPFEVLVMGSVSLGLVLVLAIARRATGARGRA